MSQTDEIKSKIDIVELIREYIQIKASGVNFSATCPFHQEKTPSFIVSPEKQIWHCFGCGKGGDIFSFIMEMEGLEFKEALQLLADKAGVDLRNTNFQDNSRKRKLLNILKLASDYYARLLNQDKAGEDCKEYLIKRSLSRETISQWSIGYSRNTWDDLIKYLKNQKSMIVSDKDIFEAGLSIKKENSNNYYDRFRSRIMFPIKNINSEVVGFTARIDPKEEDKTKMGKYINSPQSELYDKSKILFGLDIAKLSIKEQDWTLVVEGQMDAIVCHQAGYKNVVASSGTALTNHQLSMLKRYSDKIALCFDMDKAGQLAADRGIEDAMKLDMRIKIIVLPSEYKDPADCLKNDKEAFKEAVKSSLPMMEYYFNKTISSRSLDKLEDKREVSKILIKMISKLKSKIDQDHWLKVLSEKIDTEEGILREILKEEIDGKKDNNFIDNVKSNFIKIETSREEKLMEIFISILLKFSDLVPLISSKFESDYLSEPKFKSFYKNLIIYYNKEGVIDYENFKKYLKNQSLDEVSLLEKCILLGEKDYYNFTIDLAKIELNEVIKQLKKVFYQKEIKRIEKEINQAEKNGNNIELNRLMSELKKASDNLNIL